GGHHPVDPPSLYGLDFAEVHERAVDRGKGFLVRGLLLGGFVEQVFHRLLHSLCHRAIDGRRRSAKTGPPEQVRGFASVKRLGRARDKRCKQFRGHGTRPCMRSVQEPFYPKAWRTHLILATRYSRAMKQATDATPLALPLRGIG